MTTTTYVLNRLARFSLQQLQPEEQTMVREALASLFTHPPSSWPASQAQKFRDNPDEYLAPLDDDWRAIIRVPEDSPPQVVNIVHRERLEAFAKSKLSTPE